MIEKTYEQENSELLKTILSPFFIYWKNLDKIDLKEIKERGGAEPILEIIVTASCNQACQYCYLTQHGEELYPVELRNNKQIIHNLELLLDYMVEQGITNIPRLDIFSGEIWGWPLGNKIFDTIFSYLVQRKITISRIIIPSNCSFVIDDATTQVIINYINLFKSVNTMLSFSISYDGKVVDNIDRPFKINYDKTQDDYELKLRKFSKDYEYGWHPMISATTIEYQKENYKHWIQILKEDFPYNYSEMYGSVMQLEVRNDNWTDDKIYSYLDWLNFLIDTDLETFFNNDKEFFFDTVVSNNLKQKKISWGHNTYFPYHINSPGANLGCSLGLMLCIRLGDLAIAPCHRTSYPKLLLGKFQVENDKIVDIVGNNIPLANSIYIPSFMHKPFCDVCPIALTCLRGCLGSNYETNGELFDPVITNCNLQKAKIIFLYEKYIKMYPTQKADMSYPLIMTYNKLQSEEGEFFNKWKTKIAQMNL